MTEIERILNAKEKNKKKNLASMAAIYYGAKIMERHIRILGTDD